MDFFLPGIFLFGIDSWSGSSSDRSFPPPSSSSSFALDAEDILFFFRAGETGEEEDEVEDEKLNGGENNVTKLEWEVKVPYQMKSASSDKRKR